MLVVFFIAAFLFQRKGEDANYFALIWLPPHVKIISNAKEVSQQRYLSELNLLKFMILKSFSEAAKKIET